MAVTLHGGLAETLRVRIVHLACAGLLALSFFGVSLFAGSAGGASAASATTAATTDYLNFRSGPSLGARVMTVMPPGSAVTVTGTASNGFYPVTYHGTQGWAYGSYLAFDSSSSNAVLASTARRYVGAPYAWGGTTPAGFDCSGFVYYVVNKVMGGGFPRAMTSQVESGSHVSRSNLQPGDLVFFGDTYKAGLSHVGIYLGGGQFISSANENTGVVISNLNSSYWGSRYYTARRIG